MADAIQAPCYVNFREKGADPRAGGYLRCDTNEERDAFTAELKALDAKIEWEAISGR